MTVSRRSIGGGVETDDDARIAGRNTGRGEGRKGDRGSWGNIGNIKENTENGPVETGRSDRERYVRVHLTRADDHVHAVEVVDVRDGGDPGSGGGGRDPAGEDVPAYYMVAASETTPRHANKRPRYQPIHLREVFFC